MRQDHYKLKIHAICPLRGGPCLAGHAFMERLGQCCQLARRVTGSAPQMTGAVTLERCDTDSACALNWQVAGGVLELSRKGRVLLTGELAMEALQ